MTKYKSISPTAGYKNEHHLIQEKVPPESLILLRHELALAQHRDIYIAAEKGKDFDECIGIIAAHLDIALDGVYEPDDIFQLLWQALRVRGTGVPVDRVEQRLQPAELVEREGTVTLEFAGSNIDPSKAKQEILVNAGKQYGKTTVAHARFMQEAGCDVCENRAACQAAEKCLGAEAYEVGQEE